MKKEFIQAKIFGKYSRIGEWTQEEIDAAELRDNLRDTVMAQINRRLYHLERRGYSNPSYVGEMHQPLIESHLKDIIRKSFIYEEDAKKLIRKSQRRIKNESLYVFGVKKTAEYCKITEYEMNKHMKAGNIKFVRDKEKV